MNHQLLDTTLCLHRLRFRAGHGVLPQEQRVGGDYEVSLRLKASLQRAIETDNVAHTLNYAEAYAVVKREMEVPSQLIEHVAARIADALLDTFPLLESAEVSVVKLNPPMGAHTDGAEAIVSMGRKPQP